MSTYCEKPALYNNDGERAKFLLLNLRLRSSRRRIAEYLRMLAVGTVAFDERQSVLGASRRLTSSRLFRDSLTSARTNVVFHSFSIYLNLIIIA
jgi:hypothetical protein